MPLIKLRSSSIIDSVHLGGIPLASDSSSQIATTEMVNQEISNLVDSSPELLNTLGELSESLGTDTNQT
jgi:hypothetical protein